MQLRKFISADLLPALCEDWEKTEAGLVKVEIIVAFMIIAITVPIKELKRETVAEPI